MFIYCRLKPVIKKDNQQWLSQCLQCYFLIFFYPNQIKKCTKIYSFHVTIFVGVIFEKLETCIAFRRSRSYSGLRKLKLNLRDNLKIEL
jgi:hypothetical protein